MVDSKNIEQAKKLIKLLKIILWLSFIIGLVSYFLAGDGDFQRADYALDCRGTKNGSYASFVVGGDRAIYTSLHSQQYMKLTSSTPSALNFTNEYEWTVFYGPLEKKTKSSTYEIFRDHSRVNYRYDNGLDPFNCSLSPDAQDSLNRAHEWLQSKKAQKK